MKCQEEKANFTLVVHRSCDGCWVFFASLHALSGDHEWITGTRVQATVDKQLRYHVVAQVQACPLRRQDHLVRKQSAFVFISVTQASMRMKTTSNA